jgi:hypothetical protein
MRYNQAVGKSKGDSTTKILAMTDALRKSVAPSSCWPAKLFKTVGVASLIESIEFDGLIADEGLRS